MVAFIKFPDECLICSTSAVDRPRMQPVRADLAAPPTVLTTRREVGEIIRSIKTIICRSYDGAKSATGKTQFLVCVF